MTRFGTEKILQKNMLIISLRLFENTVYFQGCSCFKEELYAALLS